MWGFINSELEFFWIILFRRRHLFRVFEALPSFWTWRIEYWAKIIRRETVSSTVVMWRPCLQLRSARWMKMGVSLASSTPDMKEEPTQKKLNGNTPLPCGFCAVVRKKNPFVLSLRLFFPIACLIHHLFSEKGQSMGHCWFHSPLQLVAIGSLLSPCTKFQ